jgi:hypothetical protein
LVAFWVVEFAAGDRNDREVLCIAKNSPGKGCKACCEQGVGTHGCIEALQSLLGAKTSAALYFVQTIVVIKMMFMPAAGVQKPTMGNWMLGELNQSKYGIWDRLSSPVARWQRM